MWRKISKIRTNFFMLSYGIKWNIFLRLFTLSSGLTHVSLNFRGPWFARMRFQMHFRDEIGDNSLTLHSILLKYLLSCSAALVAETGTFFLHHFFHWYYLRYSINQLITKPLRLGLSLENQWWIENFDFNDRFIPAAGRSNNIYKHPSQLTAHPVYFAAFISFGF